MKGIEIKNEKKNTTVDMIECLFTKGLLKSIKIVIPLILQSLDCNFIF